MRDGAHCGDGRHHRQRPLGIIRGFGLVLGDLQESSWSQGFALDWIMSGRGGNLTIGYLNKFYLIGGRTRKRAKLLVRKQQ